MTPKVIVATKGRAAETATLLKLLARSTVLPARVIVVGTELADIEAITDDGFEPGIVTLMVGAAGIGRQRNTGISLLRAEPGWCSNDAIVFFDDDFRPEPHWIEEALSILAADATIAGLTGSVIRDGAKTAAIDEAESAAALLEWGKDSIARHNHVSEVASLYGCNMAFRAAVFDSHGFDERLVLYGWLEDYDFSSRARALGRLVSTRRCGGVHLGSKSGRTSGRRYGYSQIVNPVYLGGKGTMAWSRVALMLVRALASNAVRSAWTNPLFDYRGRLAGNLRGLSDIARGRVTPEAVQATWRQRSW